MTTKLVVVIEDLEILYRRHIDGLVHFATVLVGPDAAMDVVADAVLATLARGSLSRVDNVRAYWYRAVANTSASLHRSTARRLRRDHLFAGDPVSTPDTEATDARRLLSGLSTQQRAVVYLTYWHDLSPGQVAELLGVGEGTVRKQLARGRERLREAYVNDTAN